MKLNGADFILNYFFNFGSLLFMIFFFQVISGVFLRFYYSSEDFLSFNSVQYLIIEVNNGWLFRLFHFNIVSLFFIILFLHILKALYYFRYRLSKVWNLGLIIFLLLIIEAFLGYTLIWSQISFWAATVITSLLRIIPYFGFKLIVLLWCGYFLNSFSLKIFFFLHFIIPLLILVLIFFHILFLHEYGRSTKLSVSRKLSKRSFYPFYWVKDLINFFILFLFFLFFLFNPFSFNEALSFVNVNNLVSPIHIVPEWYFLWAYAILRAFSIKWIGVLIILFRVLVFFLIGKTKMIFDLLSNFILNIFVLNFILLIWLGCQEPIFPFIDLSFFFMIFYFILLLILNF